MANELRRWMEKLFAPAGSVGFAACVRRSFSLSVLRLGYLFCPRRIYAVKKLLTDSVQRAGKLCGVYGCAPA